MIDLNYTFELVSMPYSCSTGPCQKAGWPQMNHDLHFVHTLAGEGALRIGAKIYPTTPNSVLAVPPKVHCLWDKTHEADWIMINLHYKLAINDDFPLEDRYEMPIVFHPPGLQAIHRKLRRWHRGWRDGDNMAHLQIVADVHALVASYWTAFGKKLETPAQSDKQIRRVLKEIKLRINTPFNAAELAESVNLSVSQMNRRFRAETGLSPKAHWQQQRAVASRRALRERHETLEQLASVLGFSDVYYFSRWFRQQTGMTASEYRRRSRSLAI